MPNSESMKQGIIKWLDSLNDHQIEFLFYLIEELFVSQTDD